jgi:hypothetical protein
MRLSNNFNFCSKWNKLRWKLKKSKWCEIRWTNVLCAWASSAQIDTMRHHHHQDIHTSKIRTESEPWEWWTLGVADPVNSGLPPIKEERKCERGEIAIFLERQRLGMQESEVGEEVEFWAAWRRWEGRLFHKTGADWKKDLFDKLRQEVAEVRLSVMRFEERVELWGGDDKRERIYDGWPVFLEICEWDRELRIEFYYSGLL